MGESAIKEQLVALARQYPEEHPYTLALRLQCQTGRMITGAWARQLLLQACREGLLQAWEHPFLARSLQNKNSPSPAVR